MAVGGKKKVWNQNKNKEKTGNLGVSLKPSKSLI